MTLEEKRVFFVNYALHFLGTWYSWGGDDPSAFDCSGFVRECLQAVGKAPVSYDITADQMMNLFLGAGRRVDGPAHGRLVFYLNGPIPVGHAYHVEICISDELAVGAKGGGSSTITKEDAIAHNAFIKVRPIQGQNLVYMDVFNGGV